MPTTATTPSELIIAIDTTIRDKTTPNTITPITHSDLLYSMVEVLSATTAPFTGNTSGECISDIYVSNVNSCSPINFRTPEGDSINFYNGDNIKASFTESDGFKLETGVNMTIPDGSGINDSEGISLLNAGSTTNTFNTDSSTGLATNYWENNLYESSISGTSTGTTATTVFRKSYGIEDGAYSFNVYDAAGSLVYKTGVGGSGNGCNGAGCVTGASDCAPGIFGTKLFKCVDNCCIRNNSGGSEYTEFGTSEGFSNIINEVVIADDIYYNIKHLEDDTQKQFHSAIDFSTGEQIHRVSSNYSNNYIDNKYDYFDGDTLNLTQTISGTSSATTATTVFRKGHDCERGLLTESMLDSSGTKLYQATTNGGTGCGGKKTARSTPCEGQWKEDPDNPGCCIAKDPSSDDVFSVSDEILYGEDSNLDLIKEQYATTNGFGEWQGFADGSAYNFNQIHNYSTGEIIDTIENLQNSLQKVVDVRGMGVNNLYSTSISGTSSATTATTVFRKSYDIEAGRMQDIFLNHSDGAKLYQATTNGGTGCGGKKTARSTPCEGQWKEDPDNPGCCIAKDPSSDNVFSVSDEILYGEDSNLDLIKEQYATTNGFGEWQGFADGSAYNFNQIYNFSNGSSSSTIQDYEGHSYTNTSTFSPNDLIISESYSGSSSGFTGTTSVFKEDHDLINGLLTSKVDGIDSLILSTDGLSSTKVTTPAFKLEDGNQADGYVLTSDSGGTATWQAGSVSANDYVVSGEYIDTTTVITTFGGVSVNTSLVSTALLGYDTYQLSVDLDDHSYTNLYSIYGTSGSPMSIPASYQEAAPFGVNTGGVPSAIIAAIPNAAFDGWLTVGITDGDSGGVLGSTGIDFDSWSTDAGLNVTDGAVFWMTPDAGPTGNGIVVAQVSVPTGTIFTASMGLQGRTSGYSDWQESVTFTNEIPVNFKALSLTRLSGDSISIPTPEFTGNTSGNSITDLYVDNLNISTVGSGTPVTNLGVDSSGNVVNGTTGPQTIEVPITSDNITSMFGTPLIVVPAETGFVLEFISAVLVYAFDTQAYIGDGSVKISYTNAFGDVSSDVSRILATSFCFAASSNKIGSLEKHISPEGIELSENYNLAMTTDVNIQNGFPGNAAGIARLHITYNKIPTGY